MSVIGPLIRVSLQKSAVTSFERIRLFFPSLWPGVSCKHVILLPDARLLLGSADPRIQCYCLKDRALQRDLEGMYEFH